MSQYFYMPTPRKRIGFLPSMEIQFIIDKISQKNKLSQSKVTGILVEEGLISKGLLSRTENKILFDLDNNAENNLMSSQNIFKSERFNNDNPFSSEKSFDDEVNMINEFIEFKFFKKIMNNNRKN